MPVVLLAKRVVVFTMETVVRIFCDIWLRVNYPGRTTTIQDIDYLSGQAYLKSSSLSNYLKGFKTCGMDSLIQIPFLDTGKMKIERKQKLRQMAKDLKTKNTKPKKVKQNTSKTSTYKKFNSSLEVMDDGIWDDKNCIIYEDVETNIELWYMCAKYKEWAHSECIVIDFKETKAKQWFSGFAVLRLL